MNTTLTTLNLEDNEIGDQSRQALAEALKINTINKIRSRCLQILCLKKLEQLNRIDEIKSLNPIIYNSCLMKY
jgi:hypothetical protein